MIRTLELSLNERKRHSLIKINFHYSFFFIINRRLKEKRKENYFKRMRFLFQKLRKRKTIEHYFFSLCSILCLLFLFWKGIISRLLEWKLMIDHDRFHSVGRSFLCPLVGWGLSLLLKSQPTDTRKPAQQKKKEKTNVWSHQRSFVFLFLLNVVLDLLAMPRRVKLSFHLLMKENESFPSLGIIFFINHWLAFSFLY